MNYYCWIGDIDGSGENGTTLFTEDDYTQAAESYAIDQYDGEDSLIVNVLDSYGDVYEVQVWLRVKVTSTELLRTVEAEEP